MARTTEVRTRFGISIGLNVALWLLTAKLARWGSYDQEMHFWLVSIAVAAAVLVTVIPLFWRGKPWQAPIAFILLWIPTVTLYGAVCRICDFSGSH